MLAPGPDGITRVYIADDEGPFAVVSVPSVWPEHVAAFLAGGIGPDFVALTERAKHEIALALLAPPRPQE